LAVKLKAYYELMKPKVLFLMVTTSWVGMILAPYPFPELVRWIGISFGIFFVAGSGAILNHIFDRALDALMSRTAERPLVIQLVSLKESVLLSIGSISIGTVLLMIYANKLTALLALGGSLGYSVIYTLILKHATPQNISIGGLYGSLPPVLGWVALSNNFDPHAWLLGAIIFTWTPPHFWALALDRVDDYRAAAVPMLPVTHGHSFTSILIVLYTILLFPVCLLPYLTGLLSYRYALVSVMLNMIYLVLNMKIVRKDKDANKKSFAYSIGYLYMLFITMVIDTWTS
jgi:protoheme IX farnesyltransferase